MESESKKLLERHLEAVAESGVDITMVRTLLEPVDLSTWFEAVDGSPYALDDWLRALVDFDAWLSGQNIIERPVDAMIGYLECCTLSLAGTLSLPDFGELVRENLDRYGFDATRPVSKQPENDGDA